MSPPKLSKSPSKSQLRTPPKSPSKSQLRTPPKSPLRTSDQSLLENIPEVSRRVGIRDQKSMLTSKKTLGKCFGLFK